MSPKETKAKIKEYGGRQTAYLIDENGKAGKEFGAKTTPHMFIINQEGILEYAGAIDDKPTTNLDDVKKASNYVSKNLELILNKKPIQVKATNSYGCSVKYAN